VVVAQVPGIGDGVRGQFVIFVLLDVSAATRHEAASRTIHLANLSPRDDTREADGNITQVMRKLSRGGLQIVAAQTAKKYSFDQ
jgi:hypothetical protein